MADPNLQRLVCRIHDLGGLERVRESDASQWWQIRIPIELALEIRRAAHARACNDYSNAMPDPRERPHTFTRTTEPQQHRKVYRSVGDDGPGWYCLCGKYVEHGLTGAQCPRGEG